MAGASFDRSNKNIELSGSLPQLSREARSEVPLLSARPINGPDLTIVLNDTISPGNSAIAAAHASLAYYLRHGEAMGFNRTTQMHFAPQSIVRVGQVEFERAKDRADSVILTESTLTNKEVAVIHVEGAGDTLPISDSKRGEQSQERRDNGLKMYILVRNDLPRDQAFAACATASVACYQRYEDSPAMQQWVNGIFRKVVCSVNSKEFAKASAVDGRVAITSSNDGSALALAFCPRDDWPKMFRYLRLFG